ncbi:efflux RND transporter periplasmic adaptor subunit [Allorhodopirellula solitaria]|nr:HlyD family efflux transporter periplasmic adaptor subunit [Allorhodopirellula solitaria]
MSIESTEQTTGTEPAPGTEPAGNPYAEEQRTRSPKPQRSTHSPAPGNGDGSDQTAAGTAADETAGVDPTEQLPVHPSRDLPKWLLLNVAVPVLLLLAAGGLVWYLGSVESAARPPIDDTPVGRLFALPAVDVVPVRSLASTGEKLHLTADGTVVPYREASLATEVAGRIVEKSPLCEAGKYVTKGHVLMKIDPTDYALQVEQLQREQQQAYESLGEVDQEMINTNRSMELARADIELLQREVARRDALPDQFASQGELDQARRAVLTAEQQLVLYQNQLELARKKRTRLESSERLAALQLEAAKINLQRTEIVAPMDGVIVSEQAELNTFVSRGSPVVTIEDTSKVEVASKLRVDQLYWVLNQKGAERDPASSASELAAELPKRGYELPPTSVMVRYLVSGREGLIYQWRGKLSGYDGIGLDEQTRTVPVRIVVENPRAFEVIRDGKTVDIENTPTATAGPTTLVRGMFVSLRLELDPAVELVVLPSEALKPGNRVWQFVADPSVLDHSLVPVEEADEGASDAGRPSEGEPAEQAGDSELADAAAPSDESAAEADQDGSPSTDLEDPMAGFEAGEWVAGELQVLHGIRPVDEFVTTTEFNMAQDIATPSEDDPDRGKAWICEIADSELHDQAFVVVSPLGSINTDAFPVRAPAKVVSPESSDDQADDAAPATGSAGDDQ